MFETDVTSSRKGSILQCTKGHNFCVSADPRACRSRTIAVQWLEQCEENTHALPILTSPWARHLPDQLHDCLVLGQEPRSGGVNATFRRNCRATAWPPGAGTAPWLDSLAPRA